MKIILKNCLFFSLSFFFVAYSSGQSLPFESNTPIPHSYVAYRTSETILIDGMAEESVWDSTPWTAPFVDIEGLKKPKYNTQMKMLWDEKYLYFMARLEEPHVWGTLKQRDTVIFYNNDFEIFIDPDGDTHNYVEFEMNVLNTVWDLFLTAPYRNNPKVLNQWDMKGVLSAVHVAGTINDASDSDQGWSLEVAIPWTVFNEVTQMNATVAGTFWRMGFSRVNWEFELKEGRYSRKKDPNGSYLPEYNWVWSPQMVVNMHDPQISLSDLNFVQKRVHIKAARIFLTTRYKRTIAELRAKREARRRRGHKKKKKKGGDDIDRAMRAAVVERRNQISVIEEKLMAPRPTLLSVCVAGDMQDDDTLVELAEAKALRSPLRLRSSSLARSMSPL